MFISFAEGNADDNNCRWGFARLSYGKPDLET
jgi:hypothetical protein